jgi:hypothetical protein
VSISAFMILVSAAFALAGLTQTFGRHRPNRRWVGTGVLATIGGYVASEFLGPVRAWGWEWEWEGLAVVPALSAVIVVGVLAEAGARKLTAT